MSDEWLYLTLLPTSSFLWAWGGTGWLSARRYGLPVLLGVVLWLHGTPWWTASLLAISASAAFHLGYGDKVPWWRKIVAWAASGLSLCPLGMHPIAWIALTVWGGGLYVFSRKKNQMTWVLCELLYGFGYGLAVTWLVVAH